MTESARFFALQIKELEKTTKDCTIVTFDIPEALHSAFTFIQGQYLTLEVEINNEKVRRSYSLCSSPIDNEWQVAIKLIPEGKFSSYANQEMKVGDIVRVMPPEGKFYVACDNSRPKNYMAFAAGSGITPILSIIKTHLAKEPDATFKLCYINKSVASIILKEELEALKNVYLDRLEIFYFLTKEYRNIPLFDGRLDEEKLTELFKNFIDLPSMNEFFICGPEAMIFMIQDFLLAKEVDKKHIHFELFNTSGSADKLATKDYSSLSGNEAEITVFDGGKSFNFSIEQGSQNILDAALANQADLPFACKGGVCCTCRAKLIEGKVDMLANYALEEEEVEAGYILTCQAIPISKKIVVDFDQ